VTPKITEIRVATALRGVAALAVAWYHLTNMDYQAGTVLRAMGSVGWLGVEAFFVISGFVIPYSLLVADYHKGRFFSFLVRRVVRIDPPYLVSIALSIAVAYAAYSTPGYHGKHPQYTAGQVLAHLGYVNNFLGYEQINRVYWTLGIEFQFYILIGLFHKTLTRCRWVVFWLILLVGFGLNAWVKSSTLDPEHVIVHWVPLFLMGISTASFKTGLLSRNMLLARLGCCCAAGVAFLSVPITVVALETALFIAFLPNFSPAPLAWLGKISYSLYLVHAPIGERLMNVAHRFVANLALCFAISMALTLLIAWGFNELFEEPARRWAKRIGRVAKPVQTVPASSFS
jgi:peptidoglycan/LPS O-acetylase OafA/YrhL